MFRKQWIQHVEQLHSTIERGKWICGKCDHPYSTHSALINHSNLEHVRGQFQCGRHGCQFGGPSRSSIFSHQRSCTAKFRCTIDSESCQREFSSSVELRQHKRTHHLTGMASNVKPQISTNSSVPLVLAVKSSSINRNNVSIDQKNDNLKTTIVNPEIPKPEMIPLPPISTIVELHHPSIHTSCDPLQLQVAKPIVEKAQIELNPIETLPSCSNELQLSEPSSSSSSSSSSQSGSDAEGDENSNSSSNSSSTSSSSSSSSSSYVSSDRGNDNDHNPSLQKPMEQNFETQMENPQLLESNHEHPQNTSQIEPKFEEIESIQAQIPELISPNTNQPTTSSIE